MSKMKGEKLNTLDNFHFINDRAFRIAVVSCNDWARSGTSVSTALYQIGQQGGYGRQSFFPGCHLIGNMVNPDKGLNGQVWVTSRALNVCGDGERGFYVITESGTRYNLLSPFHMRTPEEAINQVLAVAPDDLRDYLIQSAPFWAPEVCAEKLSVTVNKYVEPSSSDPVAVAVYAALCNCSEDEMVRRFQADNL